MRAGEGQHPVGKRDGVIHAASTLSAMDGIAPLQNQSTRQFLITVSALRKVRNGIGRQFLFRHRWVGKVVCPDGSITQFFMPDRAICQMIGLHRPLYDFSGVTASSSSVRILTAKSAILGSVTEPSAGIADFC